MYCKTLTNDLGECVKMFKQLKYFKAKNWIVLVLIIILSVLQVTSMMLIVKAIGTLTATIIDASNVQAIANTPAGQLTEGVKSVVSAVTNSSLNDIWTSGIAIVLFAVLFGVLSTLIMRIASWNAADIVSNIREKVYLKVNKYSLADFNEFSTSSLVTRTTNDIQNVHMAFLMTFRLFFMVPILIIWSIIEISQFNVPELSSASIIWIVLLIIVVVVLLILLMPRYKVIQQLTDGLNYSTRENLTGIRVIRAFNAEKYQENKFEDVNNKYTKQQIFSGRILALVTPFIMFVMSGLQITILWVSAYVINGADIEKATYLFASTNSFIMLVNQVVIGFILLVSLFLVLPRAVVSAKRVNQVLAHKISLVDPETPVEFKEKGTIEFKNVSFAYPGADGNAISDISFKVNKGETLAFIGATGSGKTTVVNLMPRLYDATEGEVYIDGVNVKDVKQSDLRDIIGYTPQRGYLFSGNIRENVAFSNPEMSDEEVIEATKIAEAYEFVSKIDGDINSHVAQGGTNFSGGQKQRLCIARSVAKKPEILIFDDSFSALDYKTDKSVRTNIKEKLPEATRVIIAARIGTIMDADQIVVLDNGKMVGKGKHKDLLKSCQVYKEIAYSQLSKEELEND